MAANPSPDPPLPERRYRRHAGPMRATHWINALCFTLLAMSGLQILNAHPAPYVGQSATPSHRPALPRMPSPLRARSPRGYQPLTWARRTVIPTSHARARRAAPERGRRN